MDEQDRSLGRYLDVVWRRRWLIAIAIAAAGATAMAFSASRDRVYEATASVFVGPRTLGEQDLGGAFQELLFSRELVGSYADMFKRLPLAERVVEREQLPMAPSALRGSVGTKIVPETRTIEVSVTAETPHLAKRIADALVDVFVAEIQKDFGGRGGSPASVLEHAIAPGAPVGPKPVRDGVLGIFLGALLGVGGAFLLESMDSAIRTRRDLEVALGGVPIIGTVPEFDARFARSAIFDESASDPAAEAFRIVRTNLLYLAVREGLERVLITSPSEDEGKSVVAANLAVAMTSAGVATVLVDADLRRPVLHDRFEVAAQPGVSDVLSGSSALADALARPRDGLSLVPAGRRVANPADILTGRRIGDLLREADALGDLLLVDSPPILPVADAGAIAHHVDGVVLVVRSGRTSRDHARDATKAIEAVGARLVGVILNGVEEPERYAYTTPRQESGDASLPSGRVERLSRGDWGRGSEPPARPDLPPPSQGSRPVVEPGSATGSLQAALAKALLRSRSSQGPGRGDSAGAEDLRDGAPPDRRILGES